MKSGLVAMNLENLLKPRSAMKRAFVDLEHDVDDLLDEAFMLDPLGETAGTTETGDTAADTDMDQAAAADVTIPPPEPGQRMSPHTQMRLASYAAFEDSRRSTYNDLVTVGEALSGIVAAYHQSRDFINDCHADILRANELEMHSEALSAENRRMADRLGKLEKQRSRYEDLVELQKRRDAKLAAEIATLTEELNAARLETVEARNAAARIESQHGELHTQLSAKSGLAERLAREVEVLREKGVNLALELDKTAKTQAETRRKYDELAAIHGSEAANHAEMAAKFASVEQEVARVQKLNTSLEAQLADASEGQRRTEAEMAEREKRYQSESHALRSENQSLNARLQASVIEHLDAVSEVAAMKSRLGSLESEKHLAEKRYAALAAESESDRRPTGPSPAEEALRTEIVALKEKVEKLAPYAKLYLEMKERGGPAQAEFPNTFGAGSTNGKSAAKPATSKGASH